MIITKEFTVLLEDHPLTLGKLCRALADREVNILALQSFPIGGKNVTRFIVDDPKTAKTVLVNENANPAPALEAMKKAHTALVTKHVPRRPVRTLNEITHG